MKRKLVSTVAISCVGFVAALNVSEAFANMVFDIPGVGNVAKSVTIREINRAKEPVNINIKNYKVVGVNEEVEATIRGIISEKVAELQKATMEEYKVRKKDFLYLGNKENNYEKARVDLKIDLKLANEEAVSFVISKYDNQKIGEIKRYTYNINLDTGSNITLKDIFGTEYRELVKLGLDKYIANKSVKNKEILDYYESYYKTKNIEFSEETPFYINAKGNPVLIFEEREIAPKKFGKQDVEIERTI